MKNTTIFEEKYDSYMKKSLDKYMGTFGVGLRECKTAEEMIEYCVTNGLNKSETLAYVEAAFGN